MTRWDDWTWEESSRARGAPPAEPAPTSESAEDDAGANTPAADAVATYTVPVGADAHQRPSARAHAPHVFRRRRLVAALLTAALLLLLTVAIASRGGGGKAHVRPKAHVARLAPGAAQRAAAQSAAEQRAIDSVLAYTPALTSGGARGDEVALTFDDGPGPYTQQLVAQLNKLKAHATFFAVGNQEQYFSEGTVAEIASGDAIGDHTQTHPMMAQLSPHDQYDELYEQMAQIEAIGGRRPRLFRPPYGSFDATTFKELHHLHLLMILWSVDTQDYTLPGSAAIVQRALAGAKPGAIILMHDAGGNRSQTIAALPAIVQGLRRRGLKPVTVPQLLEDDPPPHGQPIPTQLSGG